MAAIEKVEFTVIESTNDGLEMWETTAAVSDGDIAMALFNNPENIVYADEREMKRMLRKVDLMLLPVLCVCYAFFYIDKTTLSYAAISGIKEDSHLKETQYSWLSSVFYFGFLAWALPTNMLMQRLPIGNYLSVNIFARVHCSRAAEACFDPAVMIIIGMWYTRKDQPIRIGLWYSANGVGIAVGEILGYGIGQMQGALASWKYEFLIMLVIILQFIGHVECFFIHEIDLMIHFQWFSMRSLGDVTTPLLSERERILVVDHLRENQTGVENKHFKWYQAKEAFLDYKLYMMFFVGLVSNIPNGGISNFGTTIIQGSGFLTLVTTLMQIPYGTIIYLAILSCVYLNDRLTNRRCLFVVLYAVPITAGAFGLHFVPTHKGVARLITEGGFEERDLDATAFADLTDRENPK
ncbi:hypothetical protein KEM54_000023 [Ascosphaera aggregata]|nr:hypothetical protein KEM54_000023 [Ascosphaera aggregata]